MAKISVAMARGADKEFSLTLFKAGGDPARVEDREDLTGGTVTVHVKRNMVDASVLFKLETGSGITHRTQTGSDTGIADVKIDTAKTAGIEPGTLVMDGWFTRPGGDKKNLFKNADLVVGESVGIP